MKIKKETFEGKRIFITGGNGFLGRQLIKELSHCGVKEICIYSRDEVKHFKTKTEVKNNLVTHCIGDVRDYRRLFNAVKGFDIAIHAAALKRINDIEENVEEAIKTNVLGTLNFARACHEANIPLNLFVSTDKACSSANAYGASKYLGEKIMANFAEKGNGHFLSVRYGNVMDSTGSVIPIFERQIKKGEKITLTDERMTRFLMLPFQAVELIMVALSNPINGAVYLPELTSFKITDLIEMMKDMYDSDAEIEVTGLRPGEKINEELINRVEARKSIKIAGFYVILSQIKEEYTSQENELISKAEAVEDLAMSSKDFLMTKPELKFLLDNYIFGGEK